MCYKNGRVQGVGLIAVLANLVLLLTGIAQNAAKILMPGVRNHITAMMFTDLKEAFARANEGKRAVLARGGDPGSPESRQPWVYSYALRGNTFLMKGHSLDFFDFYRLADNAIVKAAHLLGVAEEVLYGSRWVVLAEVAVVKPETTQRWMNLSGDPPHLMAAWENAKWVYSALQHAHIPVDPIDEVILAEEDLSQYKIIYVSGSHLARKAAQGLLKYIENGGTLYTSISSSTTSLLPP